MYPVSPFGNKMTPEGSLSTLQAELILTRSAIGTSGTEQTVTCFGCSVNALGSGACSGPPIDAGHCAAPIARWAAAHCCETASSDRDVVLMSPALLGQYAETSLNQSSKGACTKIVCSILRTTLW